MLIVALVLAVIGLASLVTAVVSGNELIAWVCIGASVLGVILLIIDAIRERQTRSAAAVDIGFDEAVVASPATVDSTYENFDAEYPEDAVTPDVVADLPDADVADETETETEVDHVSSEDEDSAMQVHCVSSDEPDTAVEYVTEAEPADELTDQ